MAKPRNKFLDRAAYLALRVFAAFVQMLSRPVAYRAAALIGDAIYFLDRRHRLRALGHLRISFPQWSNRRIDLVARESMRSLVYLGLEMLLTDRLITVSRWRQHVRLHNTDETIRLLVEKKSALIVLTGHFGNWEVLGYAMATLGFPSDVIARRLDNPYVNDYVMGLREKQGMRILDKKGAAPLLDGILDAKGTVGFIADQDAGRKGLFVDFFGRPASTFKTIGLMAMRHEAPIIVGYGRRLAPRYSFELGIERIIHPNEWADQDDPLRWITQTYTTALENVIRRDPSQYLWAHRRWKHRPPGQSRPPDGIA